MKNAIVDTNNNDLIIGFNAGVQSVSESKDTAIAKLVAEQQAEIKQYVGTIANYVNQLLDAETTINNQAVTLVENKSSFKMLSDSVVSEVARQVAKTGATLKAKSKKDNATIRSQHKKIDGLESDAASTSARQHTRDGYQVLAIKQSNLLGLEKDKTINQQQDVINRLLDIVGEDMINSSDMGTLTRLVNKLGI